MGGQPQRQGLIFEGQGDIEKRGAMGLLPHDDRRTGLALEFDQVVAKAPVTPATGHRGQPLFERGPAQRHVRIGAEQIRLEVIGGRRIHTFDPHERHVVDRRVHLPTVARVEMPRPRARREREFP